MCSEESGISGNKVQLTRQCTLHYVAIHSHRGGTSQYRSENDHDNLVPNVFLLIYSLIYFVVIFN